MSRFQLASDPTSPSTTPSHRSAYNSDSDSEDNLPYPKPLARNPFLDANFNPQTYLSTLTNRHQSLEDLRSELRSRSQLLNQELLDLVNGHYEEFLSLGSDLKGGEEKVEGVRVGVLGFEREVESIRKAVQERMEEVGQLLEERKRVREHVALGRGLLEVNAQIEELELALGIKSKAGDAQNVDSEEDSTEEIDTSTSVPIKKLGTRTQQYTLLIRLVRRLGEGHPFLKTQKPRIEECRRMLLMDLSAALKQARNEKGNDATLDIVKMFGELGAEREVVGELTGKT